ncbi:hypothetical protein B2J88_44505 [Rhodococcus sp. SRB_17]|nr:hypothetical protein [Rhodococcus sp. SRB_17]
MCIDRPVDQGIVCGITRLEHSTEDGLLVTAVRHRNLFETIDCKGPSPNTGEGPAVSQREVDYWVDGPLTNWAQ